MHTTTQMVHSEIQSHNAENMVYQQIQTEKMLGASLLLTKGAHRFPASFMHSDMDSVLESWILGNPI